MGESNEVDGGGGPGGVCDGFDHCIEPSLFCFHAEGI